MDPQLLEPLDDDPPQLLLLLVGLLAVDDFDPLDEEPLPQLLFLDDDPLPLLFDFGVEELLDLDDDPLPQLLFDLDEDERDPEEDDEDRDPLLLVDLPKAGANATEIAILSATSARFSWVISLSFEPDA